MYGLRALEYDSEGMPIEDPSNTTYGSVSGGTYPLAPAKPFSATSWLNANSTAVALGGGALLLLLLVAKAGR